MKVGASKKKENLLEILQMNIEKVYITIIKKRNK